MTGRRGDAVWRLSLRVTGRRGDAGGRLCPRMMGRRRTSCNAGTDSAFRRIQEPGVGSSEPRKS